MQEAGKAQASANPEPPQIFIFFSNAEISDLIRFALDSFYQCRVRSFTDVKEVVSAFQQEKPQLLVVDGHPPEATVLLQAAKALQCRVVVHHQKKQAPAVEGLQLAGVFNEPELLPGLATLLKEMGATVKNPALAEANPSYPFFRVGVPLLLRTNPLVADVYIRLSELKYVKLFHKGASFGKEDVEKYHGTKKVEFFYVKQGDADAVTAKLNEALEALLRQVPLPTAISTPVSLATIETVHSLVSQVGFTPEVQRLVKNNVDLVLKEMYASPSLGSILKNMAIDKDKYIAAHSHMLAEVSCALAIGMKWDSEMSFKKLTMAALLHDMGLSDQKLARIKDMKELNEKRAEFPAGALEEYRSHPRRASVLVAGMKEVPADVDKIIVQHHELPTGTGFPDSLGHVHIHPMASLLMVAHDLVDWVIDHPGQEPDMEAFINEYADKYKVGNFRKILKALLSLHS